MLTSKLSRQLTATLAELDTVRAKASDYHNKWTSAEDALRREKARSRQTAEENNQLQDVISALRSLVADKTAVLEATRTKLEEEKRVTAALSEDHIRLMEDAYANMSQPGQVSSSSNDSLSDAASYYTARSSTPANLHSESQTSLGEVSFYSVSSSLRSSPNQLSKPTARHQLYSIVSGRALLAVEMQRNEETSLGFTFACQSIPSLDSTAYIPNQQGVFVKAVREGSVAEQSLMPGDEILELNNMFCRGVPHPVVAMKLKGIQGEVNIVVARPLNICGLKSARTSPALSLPMQPIGSSDLGDLNGNIRDALHEMMQSLQMQLSEEQRQIRDEIAVCNRSVISVQLAVEDALAGRHEMDGIETSTPTGSLENLTMTEDGLIMCQSEENLDAHGGYTETDAPTKSKKTSVRVSRISTVSAVGNGSDRLYDELLKARQQLSEQIQANAELQTGMAALRAECSGSVLRARQAESNAEESARALKEAQVNGDNQRQTWENIAKQLATLTQQLADASSELLQAKQDISSKEVTISNLLQQEKSSVGRSESLHDEFGKVSKELATAKALLEEREQFINDLQNEQQATSDWQSKARVAQEELFHIRAKLSASESQLSHWQIKEQQLQAQLTKMSERMRKTEEELVDSRETVDRFEKQLHADRNDYQEELKQMEEKVCTAEMENQQLEMQLSQQRSGVADKEQQVSVELSQLGEECRELKSTSDVLRASLHQKEEEVMELHHQLQQTQGDLQRMEAGLRKLEGRELEQKSITSTLLKEKESLGEKLEDLQSENDRSHGKLRECQETISDLSKRLESADDTSNNSALEKAQLQAALDQKTDKCVELQGLLDASKEAMQLVRTNLGEADKSKEAAAKQVADLQVHISGMKTLQHKQEKEVERLRINLDTSRKETEDLKASHESSSANEGQLKASVETYRSREAAALAELESQRTSVKVLEGKLEQETMRREVLEKELSRLEKSFESISEASKSVSSTSAGQLKSLESQLRDERQQSLQSRTTCAEIQTKLKAAESKVVKQKSRIDALQNETALLQQSTDMLKAACLESDASRVADEKQLSELKARAKSLQSSLDAANDVAAQLKEIVGGNAEELGELRMEKSRQGKELEQVKTSLSDINDKHTRLSQRHVQIEQELQRCKHQLVSAETKIVAMKETAEKAAILDRESSNQYEQVTKHADELEKRLNRSLKTSSTLEQQLEDVMKDSSEQLRELTKKVEHLTSEKTALEESRAMTKQSLIEQSNRVSQERDTLAAQLGVTRQEAERLSKQLATAQDSMNTAQLKAARLQSELDRASTNNADIKAKLTAAEASVLDLKTANADASGRLEAQKAYLADVQDEFTRLQSEKKSLSQNLEGNAQTILELTTAISELQSKLQQQGSSEELRSQRVTRLDQELAESRASFAQLTEQLKDERSYVGKLRSQNQASVDANEQLRSVMEQITRDAEVSASERKQLQGKLAMVRNELDESRNQTELFSASQAAVKESLTKVLKEREDLLLELEKLKLSGQSSNQKASLSNIELEKAQTSLKEAQDENNRLAEQVGKMATLQVELFDAQTSMEQVRREASKHQDVIHALRTERDKLRDIVQQHESDHLRHGPAGAPAATKSKGKLTSSSNKKDLFTALTKAEGESERLQEYVDKMMTTVIEEAPHLLEAMSRR